MKWSIYVETSRFFVTFVVKETADLKKLQKQARKK